MDNIREKLVELFDLAARVCNKTNCDECRYFTEPSCTDQLAVDILIHNGVTVSEEALPVADKATERSVAVEKTEDQRKPEGFIGHRKLEQEWIPVSEPPETNGCYLVAGNLRWDGKPMAREAYWRGDAWLSCDGKYYITRRVTHWMPLPTPPKGA